MLLPAPWGVGGEELGPYHLPECSAAWKKGDPESLSLLDVPTICPETQLWGGMLDTRFFSSRNPSDVLCLMGKKQGKREICVPWNSHSQKWCFAKTPWQPSSSTTRDLIFMHLSNAHQSLIFCFGTTTWVLLPPPCASVFLKSACCDMKWKFPKADVAGECWASGK